MERANQLLHETFGAWRSGDLAPTDMIGSYNRYEQDRVLYDRTISVVHKQIEDRRRVYGVTQNVYIVPSNEDLVLEMIRADLFVKDPTLTRWAALYYRWLIPITIDYERLVEAFGCSQAHFDLLVDAATALLWNLLEEGDVA
ncbi:MAG: hypothetical protein AAF125_11445 [Chloroflexota bacterium]